MDAHAPIAQLDRAPDFGSGGWGFEPLSVYYFIGGSLFSGIVQGLFRVTSVTSSPSILSFTLSFTPEFSQGLRIGASVAVDGVCLTVVSIHEDEVVFDVISETLNKTTLKDLCVGQEVGCERSIKVGDEIGGHFVSGHVWGTVTIGKIVQNEVTLSCPADWMKYILRKGFVALDGASLTVVDVSPEGYFTVHLIPETLRMTSLGKKKVGDAVNLEIDSQTQVIVDTLLETSNRV